jgi:hypothetical protein
MTEIWKDIKGYEGIYQISNLGRVKSLARIYKRGISDSYCQSEKIMAIKDNGKGYKLIILKTNNIQKNYYIHRLVAAAFIDEIPYKMEVNHLDGNKSNNKLSNLEILTRSDNQKHSYSVLGRKKGAFKGMNAGGKNGNASALCIIDYGLIFETIIEAANFLNIGYSCLKAQLTGQNKKKYNIQYL